MLEKASEQVFVPLTVGGGIRGYTEDGEGGRSFSALEVAARYFRAGADKISIGSDAVTAAEAVVAAGGRLGGDSAIEQISARYGQQAVVVSIDPRRVYLAGPELCPEGHTAVELPEPAGALIGFGWLVGLFVKSVHALTDWFGGVIHKIVWWTGLASSLHIHTSSHLTSPHAPRAR